MNEHRNNQYSNQDSQVNDTRRMSQDDLHNFDGLTIDQEGNEVHVDETQDDGNNRSWGGFGSTNQGNPFGNPTNGNGARVFRLGGWSLTSVIIIALIILALIIGVFLLVGYFFWPVILIIALVWFLMNALG